MDNANNNTDIISTANTAGADNSNSETDLQKQIADTINKNEPPTNTQPEQTEPQKTETKQENNINCPDKFKNQDGTINIETVLKSYNELEPLLNEKADWQKERTELLEAKKQLDEINRLKEEQAKQAGYSSNQAMEQVFQIAKLEADEYAKYLQFTENPEEVKQKLINYANNPTDELMREIEMEFSPEVNKKVAVLSERQKNQFEKQAETQKFANIESVINQSVTENKELFNYEPFKQLFINTLYKFGDSFTFEDAKALISTVLEMKNLFKSEFEQQLNSKQQNDKATDKLASINNLNSAPIKNINITNSDIEKMSENELSKAIRQYI
mgnify:CR=1 FL=1